MQLFILLVMGLISAKALHYIIVKKDFKSEKTLKVNEEIKAFNDAFSRLLGQQTYISSQSLNFYHDYMTTYQYVAKKKRFGKVDFYKHFMLNYKAFSQDN